MTSSPEVDRELLSQLSLDAASPDAVSPAAVPEAAGADLPGDLDLADRNALRRGAGLSTGLADVPEVEYRTLGLERVVLVGVWTEGTLASAENSLRELSRLADTAGSVILAGLVQRRAKPDPATYIGAGKARELADLVLESGADTVICDGELTPGQLRSLEGVVKVKVIDRTALILDIFAQHARSKAGKAQVELAQLQYLLPRLRGWGESLARQAGGRGPRGGGRHGLRRPRRDQDRDGPAPDPGTDRQAPPRDRRDVGRARGTAPPAVSPAGSLRRDSRLHQRREIDVAERPDGCWRARGRF